MPENTETTTSDQSISAIDAAINASTQRRLAKAASGVAASPKEPKAPKAPSEPKRPRLTDEDRAARLAQLTADRADRKATRETARSEKLAARLASRSPAHMKKVNKAAANLGELSDTAQELFDSAVANLPASQVSVLAAHLTHHNRAVATERALSQKVEAGQSVTIVGGDPRFIGLSGTVFKAQRIRCYVTVEGQAKPVYLFTSDVSLNETSAVQSA